MAQPPPSSSGAASQRGYSAVCPGCGAAVAFRSAASTHAVCGYCSSTVVRSGDKLERIGKMAELFDDFSPLQLFATGTHDKRAFTIVGRLQYAWGEGKWNEWHCSFDGESHYEDQAGTSTGWLSEDNGQYVFMREVASSKALPPPENFRVGLTTAIGGVSYQVTSVQKVHLSGAQGELPKMPALNAEFTVVELRNEAGRVVSLDYGADVNGPRVYSGVGVSLSALHMQGLREDSTQEDKTAAQFSCPNCGAPLALKLEASKVIACGSCNAVIDTSKGVAQAVVSALQTEPVKPGIPLGSTGTLQGVAWQVVGFQHRLGSEPDDDEHFGWEEYLLYNRVEGFCFLVDASEGWSLVRPTTGAPKHKPGAAQASYLGRDYALKYTYKAETTYVAGEFYWQVNRGAITQNADFEAGNQKLSREQSGSEVTWSRGEAIAASKVAQAFKLELPLDTSPVGGSGLSVKTIIILIVVALIVMVLISRCSSSCDPKTQNCSSNTTYRSGTSGGAYGGGGGGGGGHK